MGSSGASGVAAGASVGDATEHGYIAESIDPGSSNSSAALVSGSIFCVRMWVPAAGTVTNIGLTVGTLGATLTAGQNLLALYTDAGVKLSETADQSVAWTTTGAKIAALITPQAVTAATFYRVLILSVGTTPPTLQRGNTGAAAGASLGQSGASLRFSRVNTGQTALPASFTPSSVADLSSSWAIILN